MLPASHVEAIVSKSGEELDRGEVAHGYEIERGRFVTFSNEELKALAPQRSTVLDLAMFVPATELADPLYRDAAYYIHPCAPVCAISTEAGPYPQMNLSYLTVWDISVRSGVLIGAD